MEITVGVAGTDVYRCNGRCLFVGDAIDLYRAIRRIPMENVLPALLRDGLIPHYDEVLHDFNRYELQANHRNHVQRFWHDANLRFQQRSDHAISILRRLGLTYQGIHKPHALGSHVGIATGYEIFEAFNLLPGERWGIRPRWHYTFIPLWSDPLTITGLTLLYEDEAGDVQWRDLRLKQVRVADMGLGFVSSCRILDESVIIYPNPLEAMRLINDCAAANGTRAPIVYAPAKTRMLRRLPIRRRTMVNIDNDIDYYRMALDNAPCLTLNRRITEVDEPSLIFNQCTNIHQALELMALPTNKALAEYLASLKPALARIEIQRLNPDSQDINNIIAASDSLNRSQILNLLKADMCDRRIKIGGKMIYQSVDGWMVDSKNGPELISDTRFTIDVVYWDSERGLAIASGTIYQHSDELLFQSPWTEIESNTYRWLQTTLLEAQRQMPDVRNGWHKKLLDISKSFHNPRTQHATTVSAWHGGRLTLPQLIIESGKLRENDECRFIDVSGAGLSMPEPLTVVERQTLTYLSPHTSVYWALFCAVARNVLAPIHQGGTTGIAVVERKKGLVSQILDTMRVEIGFETVSFESQSRNYLAQVVDLERRCPFPIFIDDQWNNSRGFRQWLDSGIKRRNCIVHMGPEVRACTALEGGWTYVSCQTEAGDSWRSLESLWRIFPQFIAFVQRTPVSTWQERSYLLMDQIMDLIGLWLETELKLDAAAALKRAKKYLAQDQVVDSEGAWGAAFVSFLIDAMAADRIHLRAANVKHDTHSDLILVPDEMVFVSQKAVSSLFKSLGVHEFPPNVILERLGEKGIKVLKTKNYKRTPGYGIDIFQWNLTSSSRASQ